MADKKYKALLILNPKSGKMKLKKKKSIFNLIQEVCENEYTATMLTTFKAGDARIYAEKYAKDHDICVCCGGDGTLNEVITGLFKANVFPPIAFIPAGSTNDMAKTLGIPTRLRKSCELVFTGTPVYHDIGLMNSEYYFSYICSFGAFTRASYHTPQWAKNLIGHRAYLIEGISEVGKLRSYKAKVKADDLDFNGEFIFGSISNAKSFAGIFRLNSDMVDLNDGKFELILIRKPDNILDIPKIFDDMIKRRYTNENIVFTHASKIEIEFDEEDAVPFATDGEFAGGHKKITVENISNRIKIISSKQSQTKTVD